MDLHTSAQCGKQGVSGDAGIALLVSSPHLEVSLLLPAREAGAPSHPQNPQRSGWTSQETIAP